MEFRQIKEILDNNTKLCEDCDRVYGLCRENCNTFYARLIKKEIMELLNKEQIETSSYDNLPKLNYKGTCEELPDNAKEGDVWAIKITCKVGDNKYFTGEYEHCYYSHGKWKILPKGVL